MIAAQGVCIQVDQERVGLVPLQYQDGCVFGLPERGGWIAFQTANVHRVHGVPLKLSLRCVVHTLSPTVGRCKPREGVRLWRNPASGSVRGRLARPEHNPGSVAAPGGVIGAVAAEGKAGCRNALRCRGRVPALGLGAGLGHKPLIENSTRNTAPAVSRRSRRSAPRETNRRAASARVAPARPVSARSAARRVTPLERCHQTEGGVSAAGGLMARALLVRFGGVKHSRPERVLLLVPWQSAGEWLGSRRGRASRDLGCTGVSLA
jgi:hypothetical protein